MQRLLFRMAQIQLAFFFLLYMKVLVEARYILEIRAHTYQNTGHRDSEGLCCDPSISSCASDCDNIFTFCLRNAGMARDDDPLNCPLGRFTTVNVVAGGDDITFSSVNIAAGVPNPMTFIGNIWPGQVQFYTEVIDLDNLNANDHVDDIYVDISTAPSPMFSQVMSYNGDHGNGRIELSFRVQCEESFFGENCTTFCQPTDDSTGHYTCGPNGEIICLQGWLDAATNCLTPVCSSNCDPVGGFCTLPGECNCHPGYTGSNCDIIINACTSSPCVRGTCSIDSQNNFQCDCPEGYGGRTCQDPITNESNTAAAIGGGVGAGVGVIVLLAIIIIVTAIVIICARRRNKKRNSFPPPLPPYSTSLSSDVYGANYKDGTKPDLASGAGSTWLQSSITDNVYEDAGTYTSGAYVHTAPTKTTEHKL